MAMMQSYHRDNKYEVDSAYLGHIGLFIVWLFGIGRKNGHFF